MMQNKCTQSPFMSLTIFLFCRGDRYFLRLNYISHAAEGKREIGKKRLPCFLGATFQSRAALRVNRFVAASDMDEMTNLNVSNRKIRKPLMERKRRARINRSLDELYRLLTDSDFATKGAKLEKADILEMTVQYLKHMKQNDWSKEAKENVENVMLERYLSGFERCAEEVEAVIDPHLKNKITCHLRTCLEKAKTQGKPHPVEKETRCSVFIQEPKDLRILPSKLPNGDVLLLLSSANVNCEDGMSKSEMWRPWW